MTPATSVGLAPQRVRFSTVFSTLRKLASNGRIATSTPPQGYQISSRYRGEDRTPFELIIAGVRGWEADLRRHFPGKSNPE
jgi:hypothetical protein